MRKNDLPKRLAMVDHKGRYRSRVDRRSGLGIRGDGFGVSRAMDYADGRTTVLPCVWSIECYR
ncbi:hypothetical protein CBM2634_P30028 [Cupriavidus taiwanensis]|uniref:Uncharacterized protein n=1 Tax=Cupriavidus taiwanensis TaxID=164546 RepID=A0A375JAR9_9BURK|nr:hypothetical protein CBM2634_P30028 [Cupriavidus taiwanensis]